MFLVYVANTIGFAVVKVHSLLLHNHRHKSTGMQRDSPMTIAVRAMGQNLQIEG
jgi:hypothetical protein